MILGEVVPTPGAAPLGLRPRLAPVLAAAPLGRPRPAGVGVPGV